MRISVFLSISTPYNDRQREFLEKFQKSLKKHGLEPRTLGVTDYDAKAPLAGCRRLMLECNGLVTIAFRRNKIVKALSRPGKDEKLSGRWLTSEFCQIEPAMAYQLGLPILVFREDGVLEQGILERGTVGIYLPVFDLEKGNIDEYFKSIEFNDVINKWAIDTGTVWKNKGKVDLY